MILHDVLKIEGLDIIIVFTCYVTVLLSCTCTCMLLIITRKRGKHVLESVSSFFHVSFGAVAEVHYTHQSLSMTSSRGAHKVQVHCCTFCCLFTAAWQIDLRESFVALLGFSSSLSSLAEGVSGAVTLRGYSLAIGWLVLWEDVLRKWDYQHPCYSVQLQPVSNKPRGVVVNELRMSPTFTVCVLVPVEQWNSHRAIKHSLLHLFQKCWRSNTWTLALLYMSAAFQ